MDFPGFLYDKSGSKTKFVFFFFFRGMEDLGSSGRLVASISTYPGPYKCPWSGVMAKNPGGIFLSSTVDGILMRVIEVIKGPYKLVKPSTNPI